MTNEHSPRSAEREFVRISLRCEHCYEESKFWGAVGGAQQIASSFLTKHVNCNAVFNSAMRKASRTIHGPFDHTPRCNTGGCND